MRVTVDAAMRARDVSHPWPDDDDVDHRRPADAVPSSPDRVPWQGPANGPDRAGRSDRADSGADDESRDGGGGERDDGSQRERRGKADRRRLGKRHARARR
jgi:hypothetical protein